jgi:hypothetical protein
VLLFRGIRPVSTIGASEGGGVTASLCSCDVITLDGSLIELEASSGTVDNGVVATGSSTGTGTIC